MLVIAGTGPSSALGMSSILAATVLGALIFGLPGGALADRLGPSRGYALGSLLRLVPLFLAAFVAGQPLAAAVIAFAYSAGSQVYSPSEMAMVSMVERRGLARAHAVLVVLQYAGQGVGLLLLSPLLLWLGGTEMMLMGGAAVYVLVLFTTGTLALRVQGVELLHRVPSRRAFAFRATLGFLAGEPRARYAVALLAFADMATKCMLIAAPIYLAHELGLHRAEMLFVVVPALLGAVIGLAWASRKFTSANAPVAMRLTLAAAIFTLFGMAALGGGSGLGSVLSASAPFDFLTPLVRPQIVLAVPLALALGLCFSVAPIGARAVLSEVSPRGQHGRVFAAQATFTELMVLLPLVIAGVGTEMVGPRSTFAFVAVVGLAVLIALETTVLPPRRQAEPLAIPAGGQ
jgi:MFS family permease